MTDDATRDFLQIELRRVREEGRPAVFVLVQTFHADDIQDGEIDYAGQDWSVTYCEPDEWDDDGVTAVSKAVEALTDEGLTEPSSSHPRAGDWLSLPDGSRERNIYTGLREEVSGFLYGFSDDDCLAILEGVAR